MKKKRTKFKDKPELIILVNDPSLTGWGWVVLTSKEHVLEVGCIKTKKEAKKRRIRTGDDTVRRISEINNILLRAIERHNVNYILSELPHGSQSASAAKMVGITSALLQTYADALKIPIEWYSEDDAKKSLFDQQATVSKTAMLTRIKHRYDVPWPNIKYKDEAIADAMAIFHVASQQSSLIKFYRK